MSSFSILSSPSTTELNGNVVILKRRLIVDAFHLFSVGPVGPLNGFFYRVERDTDGLNDICITFRNTSDRIGPSERPRDMAP